jgi:hypothetical protein
MTSLCLVRAMKLADVPYIVETWLGLLQWNDVIAHRSAAAKAAIRAQLHANHTVIAFVPDDPDAILGFATVTSTGQTLMAYTRSSARRLGICAELYRYLRKTP